MKGKIGGVGTKPLTWILSLFAIGIIVLAGVLYFKPAEEPAAVQVVPQQAITETGPTTVTGTVSCPSDDTTDGQVRYEDTLAATSTYLAGPTVYFMPKTAGQERITAGTLSTSAFSTAVDLPCVKTGTKWRAVAVTLQGRAHSADEGVDFTAAGPFVKRDLAGKAYGDLQIKVEDKVAGGATFFNISDASGDNVGFYGTSYTRFQNATTGLFINDTGAQSSLQIAADEYIDATIYMKTNATKRQFGEDGLRTFAVVDSDASSWDEPIIGWVGQASLTDVLTSMQPEDIRKFSGYEYAYSIGVVGDREKQLDYYQESAAGVTPTVDPVIEFCTEGRYNSAKQTDAVLVGCWTDATTQVLVGSPNRNKLTFNVV